MIGIKSIQKAVITTVWNVYVCISKKNKRKYLRAKKYRNFFSKAKNLQSNILANIFWTYTFNHSYLQTLTLTYSLSLSLSLSLSHTRIHTLFTLPTRFIRAQFLQSWKLNTFSPISLYSCFVFSRLKTKLIKHQRRCDESTIFCDESSFFCVTKESDENELLISCSN